MANANDTTARFGRIKEAQEAGDVDYLVGALNDPDHRFSALRALGDLDATVAIPAVMRLLTVNKPTIRAEAAKVLGRFRAEDAIPALIEMALHDPVAPTRSYAVGALGRIGGDRAVSTLVTLLEDEEKWIRRSAVTALEDAGDAAIEPALRAASRREPLWRRGRYRRAARAARRRATPR